MMTGMRLVFLLCLCCAPLLASAVEIEQGYTRYMREGQFQHLREFFSGEEYTGRRLIERSDPANRAGQYFVLILDARLRELPSDTVAVLDFLSANDLDPRTQRFPLQTSKKPGSRQIYLGLTGDDWNGEETQLIAWRVRLLQGEQQLAEWKSFLWEMP